MQNRITIWKNLSLQSVLFVIFAVVLFLLLYRRDINGVETNKFVLLGFVSVYALVADYKHLMMLTAFILPLTNGLPSNYIMPILCLLIVVKGGKRMKVPCGVWISFILISLSEYFHVALFAKTFDVPSFVGYCSFLFLILIIGGSFDSKSEESKNAWAFCLGTAVMLTIIMLNFQNMIENQIVGESTRMGYSSPINEDMMTLRTNPNNIALYSLASISIVSILFHYKRINVWGFILVIIPSVLGGVYSVSRTWVLSMILFAILYVLMTKGKSKLLFILVSVAGLCGFFFIASLLEIDVLDMFSGRFEGENIGTAGNRTIVFESYNNWMVDNPWAMIFGTGVLPYKEVTHISLATHNAFQQIFVSYGAPGLLFFIYLIYRLIKRWRVPGERIVFLPILIIGFFLQSLQFLNPFYCAYPFLASFYVLKLQKKN